MRTLKKTLWTASQSEGTLARRENKNKFCFLLAYSYLCGIDMKSALKYIIPLICFVAFFGGNDAVVNGQDICTTVETAMHYADLSAEDTECILSRTTSTVNGAQRVSKNVRQGKPGQRRCSADLKACQAPTSCTIICFNANPKSFLFSYFNSARRLVSLGRLII